MFPDWLGQLEGQRIMPRWSWWQSIQWKWGGTRVNRKSRTEYINELSLCLLCCLTEHFIHRNTKGEYWAVVCENWIVNSIIAGKINYFPRCGYLNLMRATSTQIILYSSLPQSKFWIYYKLCQQRIQICGLVLVLALNQTRTSGTDFTLLKNQSSPNPCFFGRCYIFTYLDPWLQLIIWIVIIPQYETYINYAMLDDLSPPILQYTIQSIFIESQWIRPIFRRYFAVI